MRPDGIVVHAAIVRSAPEASGMYRRSPVQDSSRIRLSSTVLARCRARCPRVLKPILPSVADGMSGKLEPPSERMARPCWTAELGQTMEYIVRVQSSLDEAMHLRYQLIDHGEHAELPPGASIHDEVTRRIGRHGRRHGCRRCRRCHSLRPSGCFCGPRAGARCSGTLLGVRCQPSVLSKAVIAPIAILPYWLAKHRGRECLFIIPTTGSLALG